MDKRSLFAVEDINWRTASHTFPLVRCTACGLVYLSPAPTAEECTNAYPPRYYTRASGAVTVTKDKRDLFERGFRYRAGILEKYQKKGRILDVGCGDGYMIEYLKRHGWDGYGAERSETACAYAIGKLKIGADKMYCGDFLESPIPEQSFDCITLYDVLEHLPSPAAVLEKCRALLKPGGGLFLQVPNFNSLGRKLFGRWWIHLDAPRHLLHFTEASLPGMLKAWRIVSIKTRTDVGAPYISGYSDSLRHWIRRCVLGRKPPEGLPTTQENPSVYAARSSNPLVPVERMVFRLIGAMADMVAFGEMIQLYARKE
jgi:SAM-dependent methyltransferase